MKDEFHRLRVLETQAETRDATSLSFHVPPSLRDRFCWRAGQHVTLRFRLEGIELRRPYSISDPSLAGRGVWWEVIGVLTWGFVL